MGNFGGEYFGNYLVSNYGRIYSLNINNFLRIEDFEGSYEYLCLRPTRVTGAPTTMAEELGLMSAQLILDLNDGDINEVNALK